MSSLPINFPTFRTNRTYKPCRRTQRAPLRFVRAKGDADEGPRSESDELFELLRKEVLRKRDAESQVEGFVEKEKDKLREIADETKDAFDKFGEQRSEEAAAAFDKALESINEMSSDLEKELEEARKRREADEEEFLEWEAKMTETRNEGQFFKNLYTPVVGKQRGSKKQLKQNPDEQNADKQPPTTSSTQNSQVVPNMQPLLIRTCLIGFAAGVYAHKLFEDLQAGNSAWVLDLAVMSLVVPLWPFDLDKK